MFLDKKKTFDSVIRRRLERILSKRNYDENCLSSLKSLYAGSSAKVLINGEYSEVIV